MRTLLSLPYNASASFSSSFVDFVSNTGFSIEVAQLKPHNQTDPRLLVSVHRYVNNTSEATGKRQYLKKGKENKRA